MTTEQSDILYNPVEDEDAGDTEDPWRYEYDLGTI